MRKNNVSHSSLILNHYIGQIKFLSKRPVYFFDFVYLLIATQFLLKVRSCKLYNNKYMVVATQITNTEISAFIAVLVFKLISRKVLFINRKGNRNC